MVIPADTPANDWNKAHAYWYISNILTIPETEINVMKYHFDVFFCRKETMWVLNTQDLGSINAVVSLCKSFPFYTLCIVYYIPSLLDDWLP